MNVGELRKMLDNYPDDMVVIRPEHSDQIECDMVEVFHGVPQSGGWVMDTHPTMSAENKAAVKKYLRIF